MLLFYLPNIASYNIKIIANSRRKPKPLKQLFCVNFVSDLTVLGWQNLSCEKQFQPQKGSTFITTIVNSLKNKPINFSKGYPCKDEIAFPLSCLSCRSKIFTVSFDEIELKHASVFRSEELWSSEQYQRGNEAWLSCKRRNNNKAKTWRALSLYH